MCCGSCGVLDEIPTGHVILPTRALRDEGASYQYLPASRFIELEEASLNVLRSTLDELCVPYIECATWSTDALYRETEALTAYRRDEGCKVVEMECAAMAAVAKFRQKTFCQLLYSGDILTTPQTYDDRSWRTNTTARERLGRLALAALVRL